jgi:hypothetical protein
MPQHEVAGEISDGRRDATGMTLDSDEQLMLDMSEARLLSLCLAPVLELAEADPECQQPTEILARWLTQLSLPDIAMGRGRAEDR